VNYESSTVLLSQLYGASAVVACNRWVLLFHPAVAYRLADDAEATELARVRGLHNAS
jgi:hypothetical protein